MEVRQIEKLLESQNPQDVQKGVGYAVLTLLKEMKNKQVTTLDKRPPENGDIITMHCSVCNKNSQFVFKKKKLSDGFELSAEWECVKCCHTI